MRPLLRTAAALAPLLALASLVGACSGGDDGDDAATTTTAGPTTTASPSELEPSDPGTGTLALGGTLLELRVTGCAPEPPGDGTTARTLFELTATGDAGEGGELSLRVQRFETVAQAATTFTDTITYEDEARVYQAQRFEVDGTVTDLRDESATTPLLQIDGRRVTAAGTAGPPGDQTTRIELRLDATCPAEA